MNPIREPNYPEVDRNAIARRCYAMRQRVESSDISALAELKTYPNWLVFRMLPKGSGSGWSKDPWQSQVPARARNNDPATWTRFEKAALRGAVTTPDSECGNFIYGFALDPEAVPLVCVDIDHAVDTETGLIHPFAEEAVRRANSFTEVSFSGTGFHIFVRGLSPLGRDTTSRKPAGVGSDSPLKVDVFSRNRFIALTGDHFSPSPRDIRDAHEFLNWLAESLGLLVTVKPQATLIVDEPVAASDESILQQAFGAQNSQKVRRLFGGDGSGYATASEAFMALACCFAFWTKDTGQVARLIYQSRLRSSQRNRSLGWYLTTARKAIEWVNSKALTNESAIDWDYVLSSGTGGDDAK